MSKSVMPEHLKPIWDTLMEYEGSLSDGFGFYGTWADFVEICQKLYDMKVKQ